MLVPGPLNPLQHPLTQPRLLRVAQEVDGEEEVHLVAVHLVLLPHVALEPEDEGDEDNEDNEDGVDCVDGDEKYICKSDNNEDN